MLYHETSLWITVSTLSSSTFCRVHLRIGLHRAVLTWLTQGVWSHSGHFVCLFHWVPWFIPANQTEDGRSNAELRIESEVLANGRFFTTLPHCMNSSQSHLPSWERKAGHQKCVEPSRRCQRSPHLNTDRTRTNWRKQMKGRVSSWVVDKWQPKNWRLNVSLLT